MKDAARHLVPLSEAFRYWLKLGFINFGGPAGQIAVMHSGLVEEKRWISNDRFLHALNFCVLLPGPEAQQLSIYVGWLLNGTLGGIIAGVLFVLPGFLVMLGLAWAFVTHGDVSWVSAVFYGLKAAVIGIVFAALVRLSPRALRNPVSFAIAALAFIAIFLVKVAFPLIIIAAALIGFLGSRVRPDLFRTPDAQAPTDQDGIVIHDEHESATATSRRRTLRILLLGLAVWWAPLLLVILLRGGDDTLSKEAIFFSQMSLVTFGGAYSVLAYINQAAVHQFGWLGSGQMITALGLAESTPGPLILVAEFVGFLGAYNAPGDLGPLVAGILGATVTAWATFAPCFLWIFAGAPYVERVRNNNALNATLAAMTAAVVGLILSLAITFSIAVLFEDVGGGELLDMTFPVPEVTSLDPFALAVAATSFVALWRFRVNVLWIVGGSALAGLMYRVAF